MTWDYAPGDLLWATWDHVIPRIRGGTNAAKNLLLAHRDCNTRRGHDESIVWLCPPSTRWAVAYTFRPKGAAVEPEGEPIPWSVQWMIDKGLMHR